MALLLLSQHTQAHGHRTWVEAAHGACGQGPGPLRGSGGHLVLHLVKEGFLLFQEIV